MALPVANGADGDQPEAVIGKLEAEAASGRVMAPVAAANGITLVPDALLNGQPSVTLDAVIVIAALGQGSRVGFRDAKANGMQA